MERPSGIDRERLSYHRLGTGNDTDIKVTRTLDPTPCGRTEKKRDTAFRASGSGVCSRGSGRLSTRSLSRERAVAAAVLLRRSHHTSSDNTLDVGVAERAREALGVCSFSSSIMFNIAAASREPGRRARQVQTRAMSRGRVAVRRETVDVSGRRVQERLLRGSLSPLPLSDPLRR